MSGIFMYTIFLEFFTNMRKAITPVSVSLLVRVKDVLWIKDVFGITEKINNLFTVHLFQPWATDKTVVVLTR